MIPVKTGVAGLDEFLLGGLAPKVILLSGSPGSGNEVFTRQVLYQRVKNCPITYFTVNATAEAIRDDMLTYGWNIAPFETTGTWKFKSLKNLKITALAESVMEEIENSRTAAIDSISELLLTHDVEEIANLIIDMAHHNRKTQNYHLLLLTEGMQSVQSETTINHFTEGAVNFALNWAADSTVRQLIIRKMAGTVIPTRRLTYTLGRRGFIIETATRIS
jgi:KaiC/GvpD/RAD55 family RecA-like ATPase